MGDLLTATVIGAAGGHALSATGRIASQQERYDMSALDRAQKAEKSWKSENRLAQNNIEAKLDKLLKQQQKIGIEECSTYFYIVVTDSMISDTHEEAKSIAATRNYKVFHVQDLKLLIKKQRPSGEEIDKHKLYLIANESKEQIVYLMENCPDFLKVKNMRQVIHPSLVNTVDYDWDKKKEYPDLNLIKNRDDRTKMSDLAEPGWFPWKATALVSSGAGVSLGHYIGVTFWSIAVIGAGWPAIIGLVSGGLIVAVPCGIVKLMDRKKKKAVLLSAPEQPKILDLSRSSTDIEMKVHSNENDSLLGGHIKSS